MIVSNHRLFADLLAMTIATAPDLPLEIVEIASSGAAAIVACATQRPDVVLLDLALPHGQGMQVAEHVVATLPAARVIVVSRQSADLPRPITELFTRGVVCEADTVQSLVRLLADLLQPPVSGGARNSQAVGRGRRPVSILSQREREVLALIGQQFSSREIAERLQVSLHTINAHRKNIARKLGVPGVKLALVAYEYRGQITRAL